MLEIVLHTKSIGFQSSSSRTAKWFSTYELCGGGRGIRTPGTVSGTAVFKTARFNHSRIPPRRARNKLQPRWRDLLHSLSNHGPFSNLNIYPILERV